MALPIIEVEYFNSYWMKRVYTPQPSTFNPQVPRSYYEAPSSQQRTLGGEGNNAWMGVFPISTFEIPNPNTSQITIENCNLPENWYLEESRIRGGYNDAPTDLGARAYLDEEEPIQQHRFNSLIYSGIFNSRTGINRTNEFPSGTVITKSANPINGSIQRLYAEQNNLVVLQQDKCSRALIDKDAIYNAEGGGAVTTSKQVLGEIVPYAGEYGISNNPESFAVYAFRKYFVDRNRNAVLRLSGDGITEVQEYGMRDWFRDNLAPMEDDYVNTYELGVTLINIPQLSITSVSSTDNNCFKIIEGSEAYLEDNTGIRTFIGYIQEVTYNPLLTQFGISVDRQFDLPPNVGLICVSNNRSNAIGGWDSYNKQYVVSLQYNKPSTNVTDIQQYESTAEFMRDGTYYTVGFDEAINGWPSFYTYRPGIMGSLKNIFYTVDNLYKTIDIPLVPVDVWSNGNGRFGIYEQFSSNVNRGEFYQTDNPSTVTVIANSNPSIEKNFLTLDYEGSNGWKVTSMISDQTGFDKEWAAGIPLNTWKEYIDSTNKIFSYYEGAYDSLGNTGAAADPLNAPLLHAGFDRKENRYVANLINNTSPAPGEVIFGDSMSGIKGYYSIIQMSTDTETDPGGMKELFQLSATFNVSST